MNSRDKRDFYNYDLKLEFINKKLSRTASYINAYYSLFSYSSNFEAFYNKDLYSFTSYDIKCFIENISSNIRYMSALLYNDLIRDYKRWALKKFPNDVVDVNCCPAQELKSITTFRTYTILNDEDIYNLTEHDVILDGSDYISTIFIRLFWEIDGQEIVKDILDITIDDLDIQRKTLKIGDNTYPLSDYLVSLIYNFAITDELEYRNKGSLKIKTADENNGYIFRTPTQNGNIRQTAVGEPITTIRFSDLFHDFVERKTECFTVNDLSMSLALKYMLKHFKTHTEMQTERRYFNRVTSNIYGDILQTYGKEKYPKLYKQYIQYFDNLRNSFYKDTNTSSHNFN